MKTKVINAFRDKETKTIHEVGEELEITKERFVEINSTSFGIFLEVLPEKSKKTKQDSKEGG